MSLTAPDTDDISHAEAFGHFQRVMARWELSHAQAMILLRVSRATHTRWRSNPDAVNLDRDQMERLSYVFVIDDILFRLFKGEELSIQEWLRTPHGDGIFGGDTPQNRMLGGQVADIYEVAKWLRSRIELMD